MELTFQNGFSDLTNNEIEEIKGGGLEVLAVLGAIATVYAVTDMVYNFALGFYAGATR